MVGDLLLWWETRCCSGRLATAVVGDLPLPKDVPELAGQVWPERVHPLIKSGQGVRTRATHVLERAHKPTGVRCLLQAGIGSVSPVTSVQQCMIACETGEITLKSPSDTTLLLHKAGL